MSHIPLQPSPCLADCRPTDQPRNKNKTYLIIHYLLPWKEIVMIQKTAEFLLSRSLYIRTTLSLILMPGLSRTSFAVVHRYETFVDGDLDV
jgi:hypothetical protein